MDSRLYPGSHATIHRILFDSGEEFLVEDEHIKQLFEVGDRIITTGRRSVKYAGSWAKGTEGVLRGKNSKGDWRVHLKGRKYDQSLTIQDFELMSAPPVLEISSTLNRGIPKPATRGIRLRYRIGSRSDTVQIVGFTARSYSDLPREYTEGYPNVGLGPDGCLRVVSQPGVWYEFGEGTEILKSEFEEIVKTCKVAGKRLRQINQNPVKEIVV